MDFWGLSRAFRPNLCELFGMNKWMEWEETKVNKSQLKTRGKFEGQAENSYNAIRNCVYEIISIFFFLSISGFDFPQNQRNY